MLLRAVLVSLTAAAAFTSGLPAEAGSAYSAPLRTAVRQLPVAPESTARYDRDRSFGRWVDADGDCQSTRHEVLASQGTSVTLSRNRCTVTGGRWVSTYDGRTYTSPAQLQVDHLVPVSEAWDSGAERWTQGRRVAFYNDLGVGYALNVIAAPLNQAKGDRGPEAWLPPADRCRYVARWTAVKVRWGLTVDEAERAALLRLADRCPDVPLTVPRG